MTKEEYVPKVLRTYCAAFGTAGTARPSDGIVAVQLYEREVPLPVIENALVLGAARRLMRPAGSPPLSAIRSLAYFLPVIDEVLAMDVSPDYFQHVRTKIARYAPAQQEQVGSMQS